MIAPPPGWRTHRAADRLLLYPVDGTAAVAEYREVVRPLAGAAEAVASLLAGDPRFEVTAVGEPEQVVSHEGEYGALVTVAGRLEGRAAQRDVGLLFADDYYARTDCVTLDPLRFGDMSAIVRGLVAGDSHGLGVRQRRFRYLPPDGWHARERGTETTWLPPGAPAATAAITVWPALPHHGCAAGTVRSLVAQASSSSRFAAEHLAPPTPTTSRAYLDGALWDLVGTTVGGLRAMRTIALLQDDRYVYPARLDQTLDGGRDEEHRAAFLAMIASTQGIPAARATSVADATAALDCWVD